MFPIELVTSFGSVQRVGGVAVARRRFGVPPGGPFDFDAARLANALVGRPLNTNLWELAISSATFTAETDGFVATVGASARVTIGSSIGVTNSVRRVIAGESVTIAVPTAGCRVYCQWGLIGREGRIDYDPGSQATWDVITGPDAHRFPAGWPETVRLSSLMNRVGVRAVAEDRLTHDHKLPSKPQVVGSGQVTPLGELIIIGPDGPVTGGYPQILTVARTSMSTVAQSIPGQVIRLRSVSIEDARAQWDLREAAFLTRLKEIGAGLATPVSHVRNA